MGKLASDWKGAKDAGEKACKEAIKAGKKAGFPTFKSDFQKNQDKFEAQYEATAKIIESYRKALQNCILAAGECKKIAEEYRGTIQNANNNFDGPTTRTNVLGRMNQFLLGIDNTIDLSVDRLKNSING